VRVLPVRDVLRATPRTRIIVIDLGETPFIFRAGQAVRAGLEGIGVPQPYSIACSPDQAESMRAIELLVQLDSTNPADPHLELVAPGTRLAIEGPFGSFALPKSIPERDVLFVAGGTGIAPLRSMIHDVLARGDERRMSLVYSARSANEFAYESELRALAEAKRLNLHLTVTRDDVRDWTGWRGRIDAARIAGMLQTPETRCVICGPPAMVDAVITLLGSAGISNDRIVTETFVA
jgi:ferredoxin-NADP reductase